MHLRGAVNLEVEVKEAMKLQWNLRRRRITNVIGSSVHGLVHGLVL